MKPQKSRPMLYTPRTIALICELFHPPIQPDPGPIQQVHNQMFQSGDPPYSSFAVTQAGAVLSNPVSQPGANSYAAFLQDRFQFREEMSSVTFDAFASRVKDVSGQVSQLRGIQLFAAQQVTVRTLVNPRNFKDSRAFLRDGMFDFADELQSLGRSPHLFGMRLVFPPEAGETNAYSLRIESFNNDPRSLYLENQASFGPIVVEQGLDSIESNIHSAYRFVVDNALRFISRFDASQDAEEES